MRNAIFAVLIVGFTAAAHALAQTAPANSPPVPVVERYRLVFRIDPEHHMLSGEAEIKVRAPAERAVTVVPVLLYRLMDVQAASDAQGTALAFEQRVMKFPDEPSWQVNSAQVKLAAPLAPGQAASIRLKYAGQLFGYREVMEYVRDTISDEYSLIRLETMAYPFIAAPSEAGWRQSLRSSKFAYEIDTVVPEGFVAVCSGKEIGEPKTKDGRSTFHCAGEGSSHLSVAAAKFRVFDDAERNLRVYALPADAEAGGRVMSDMRHALDFYRSYLGEVHGGGLILIEIPDGWGSYAVSGHIFQAAAAFKDKERVNELYHEVSHRWNVCMSLDSDARCSTRVVRARYFDEAFATYFEALAVRQFQDAAAFREFMQRSREYFTEQATRDPRGRTTAISDYAREELGGFSYTKGPWSLHVLHQLLGENMFRQSIAEFLAGYSGKPVAFEDFRRSLEKTSGRNLQCWFQEWIMSGPESSALLMEGKSVEEMAARCQTSH